MTEDNLAGLATGVVPAESRKHRLTDSEALAGPAGRIRGVVVWFDAKKGYGFLLDQSGVERFCHFTGIAGEGFRTLVKDAEVEFSLVPDPSRDNRLTAKNVVVIKPQEQSS